MTGDLYDRAQDKTKTISVVISAFLTHFYDSTRFFFFCFLHPLGDMKEAKSQQYQNCVRGPLDSQIWTHTDT